MDTADLTNVGHINDLDYWCEAQKIFKYLDTVSPLAGSKFKCPVCSGAHWGCSTIEVRDAEGNARSLVAPCEIPIATPNGSRLQVDGKDFPNYHYALICITCSHTVFFNAAMVQARMKLTEGLKDGQ